MKNLAFFASLIAGAAFIPMGSEQASAQTIPPPPGTDTYYYHIDYYSDATMTTVIGYQTERCLNNLYIVTSPAIGNVSEFYLKTAIGQCPGSGDW